MQNMECLESAQRALTDSHWPNALRTFQLPTSWDAVKRVTAWAVVDVVSHWCHTAPCRPAALCTPSVLGVRRCHEQSPALWWGDQPSQAKPAKLPSLCCGRSNHSPLFVLSQACWSRVPISFQQLLLKALSLSQQKQVPRASREEYQSFIFISQNDLDRSWWSPKRLNKNYSKPNPLETPTLRIIRPSQRKNLNLRFDLYSSISDWTFQWRVNEPNISRFIVVTLGPQNASFWRGFGILRAPVIQTKTFTTHIPPPESLLCPKLLLRAGVGGLSPVRSHQKIPCLGKNMEKTPVILR